MFFVLFIIWLYIHSCIIINQSGFLVFNAQCSITWRSDFFTAYPAIYEIVSIGMINYAVWIMVNFNLFI